MAVLRAQSYGFTKAAIYRRREPHAFHYLTERATFWIAVLSVFAFVTGNMVGTHGWRVFWKSVMGEGSDSLITFTGTVPPLARVPDFERWGRLGGDVRLHTFRQVPADLLVPLRTYSANDSHEEETAERRLYYVKHLGSYTTGRGKGSHPGVDIAAPIGTPVQAIANGVVQKIGDDRGGYGIFVVLRHPNAPDPDRPSRKTTLYSVYAHLSAVTIEQGRTVLKGEQIALTGKTGFATGPHLHFQVDRDTAPWHPYWLFTTAEARDAGLNFSQAVDNGLFRDRGLTHTVDPMLFVQGYATFGGFPVAQDAETSSSSSAVTPRRRITVADRRALRMARLTTTSTTLVAFTDDGPRIVIPAAETSESASSPSSAAPARLSAPPLLMSVGMRSDREFTSRRQWKKITLTLLGAEGNVVRQPLTGKKLALRAAFGRAEFKPSVFSVSDFKDGVLEAEILPMGDQTVVFQVLPFEKLSEPMQYKP